MMTYRIIIIVMSIILISCYQTGKITICECNKELNYAINKLNGVYLNKDDGDKEKILYGTHFLFSNGTYFYAGHYKNLEKLQLFLTNYKGKINKENIFKSNWGCYDIKNSTIAIQGFYETSGGHFAYERLGKILNDSTFIITQSKKRNKIHEYIVADTFKFYSFTKPDSTNWLIEKKCK